MLKRDELADPNSCFNRAADDEMIFVLLARDVATPHAIREWSLERVCRGKNIADDAQIVEALQCAEMIEARHERDEAEVNSFSQNKAIRSTFPSLHNLLTDPLDRLDPGWEARRSLRVYACFARARPAGERDQDWDRITRWS